MVVAGKFGNVDAVVTAWDMNSVIAHLPAGIRGVGDHQVSVTVASVEARRSVPMSAEFVAQRERIDVPARLWQPDAFHSIDTTDSNSASVAGPFATFAHISGTPMKLGQERFILRVNEQCALDTMDIALFIGQVRRVQGWEAGPPYQGSVAVDWSASCVQTTINYEGLAASGYREEVHCRVSFQMKATAYCPLGVSPDPVSLKAQGAPPRLR